MTESTTSNGTVFYDYRLSNGLQIVGQPMPDFESAAVSYYVRTGSRDEPDPSIAGVSHFLEHMVFKGTKTLDWQEITLEFNKIGAEINASTSHESTVYYARVLGEYLERAVELLSDMMYPRLVESDFETEKEVIINEIARSEDQPYNLAFRRMMQTYFGSHPLGHDLLFEVLIHNDVINRMCWFIWCNLATTLTCVPVCAVFFSKTNNMLPVKVASNGKNYIVRGIAVLPIVAHLPNVHIANAHP